MLYEVITPIYTRKKELLDAEEELLFDCNTMAKGHDYFKLAGFVITSYSIHYTKLYEEEFTIKFPFLRATRVSPPLSTKDFS